MKIFHKNPTQVALNRPPEDFSPSKVKESQEDEERGEVLKFLSRKTHRDDPELETKKKKILDEMPESLKEVIRKYKDRKFTIDLYERYRVYKAGTKFVKQSN